jgi:hypothetical protein
MPRRNFERKGDAIESYLREHPQLGPTDLAALISRETTYETTAHQVSLVKTRLRQEGQLPTAARTTPRAEGQPQGPAAAGGQAEAASGARLADSPPEPASSLSAAAAQPASVSVSEAVVLLRRVLAAVGQDDAHRLVGLLDGLGPGEAHALVDALG